MDLSRQEQHRDRHDPRHQPAHREEPRAEDAAEAERPQPHPGRRQGPGVATRQYLARVAPFAAFVAILAIEAALDAAGILGDAARDALTLGRAFVAAAVLAFFWGDYVELHEAPRARASDWLAAAAGIVVFVLWITFDTGWAVVGGEARGFVPAAPLAAALRLIGFAAVVPVMEELFWRSFLMRWIQARDFLAVDPRRTGFAAFALSSALFASEHSLWLAGLVAGIAYGWVYKRSGNLWTAIVSHAITNGALGIWILATGSWKYW